MCPLASEEPVHTVTPDFTTESEVLTILQAAQ